MQSSKLKRIYETFRGMVFQKHFLRYIEYPKMLPQLLADNLTQREALSKQNDKMDTLLSSFEKFVIDNADDLEGGAVSDGRNIATADPTKSKITSDSSTDKLATLLAAYKSGETVSEPVGFHKVSKVTNDPVLHKHTAATHFTPLVHGHKPRESRVLEDRRDDYYDDSNDYRRPPSDRKRRRLLYFDIEPHMAFDSRSTDYRTFEDTLSANLSLIDSLTTQGYSVSCYLKHIRFLVDKSKVYTAASLVRYDQAVRERADVLGESSMVYGDHELVHRFLGPENIKPKTKPNQPDSKGFSKSENRKKLPVGYCWK